MSTRRVGRFAKGATLLLLSVGMAFVPSIAAANCVTTWESCRDSADKSFVAGRVGVVGYAALMTGCDVGYIFCSTSKEKENGK
jgi:hypothetical protein